MQFYLDGFYPGDPAVIPIDAGARPAGRALPAKVDVLIVGSGPAGLLLGAQLAQFPSICARIVEHRPGPLRLGQADGIACRTVEMLEAFGLTDRLLREAYWVNETSFWAPSTRDRGHIERTGRVQDTEDGLSEFPHVTVNQARIHDYLLSAMRRSGSRLEPDYGLEFLGLETDRTEEHPVRVTIGNVATGERRVVRTRYLVGCDGAHSRVRTAIGRELSGEVANHAWGVMDVLSITDFPDTRLKAAIQSAEAGNMLLIPREGGYLVRLYVDLGVVTEENRARVRGMTAAEVVAVANRVLRPYTLKVAETAWFSIYEVAQRLTDAFDDAAGRGLDPRVFIAGDACHTHSAKAGQGMNVALQDAFNLGWKLGAVLGGLADPSLLSTYSAERQPVARELIEFDLEWSAMMAAPPADRAHPDRRGVDPDVLKAYFVRHARYTAGVATRYAPSTLTGTGASQHLAAGFEVGTRFHSAPVLRVADARRMELGHVARADGRWRLYVFAGAHPERLRALCEWLASSEWSPIRRHTPEGADIDAVIDVRAILQDAHRDVAVGALPRLLLPRKGRYGLLDYEKVFTARGPWARDIFDLRGVDRTLGCAVIVRPDQYVSEVLPLADQAALTRFFDSALRGHDREGDRPLRTYVR